MRVRSAAPLPHKRVPGSGWQGLLTEYVVAPERVLLPLADDASFGEGAMVEPLAVAWHTNLVGGGPFGHSLAVLGAGAIGSLVSCVGRLRGVARLFVSDRLDSRLKMVEKLTDAYVVNPSRADVVGEGHELTGGEGFDVVVVASRTPVVHGRGARACAAHGERSWSSRCSRPHSRSTSTPLSSARL